MLIGSYYNLVSTYGSAWGADLIGFYPGDVWYTLFWILCLAAVIIQLIECIIMWKKAFRKHDAAAATPKPNETEMANQKPADSQPASNEPQQNQQNQQSDYPAPYYPPLSDPNNQPTYAYTEPPTHENQ